MNIELSGIFPANQGAMLMLEAVLAQLREKFPSARIATPPGWSKELRQRYDLWLTPGPLRDEMRYKVLGYLPRPLRERLRFLPLAEIDVLLDVSGFGYGDFWGIEKLSKRLAERLDVWKKAERRAILLPQAFGPFEREGMAEGISKSVAQCELVFARDSVSYAHLSDTCGTSAHIRLAPDFTNLLTPSPDESVPNLVNEALIIPNNKMIVTSDEGGTRAYIDFLTATVSKLRNRGVEPILLLHEKAEDVALAARFNRSLDRSLKVFVPDTPMQAKAIIGAARLVISSRFHGLVSALSSGVPALASGWSHKYLELLKDYDCGDLLIDIERPDSWPEVLDTFLNRVDDPSFREALRASACTQKAKSQQMWDEVFRTIRSV